MRVLSTAFLISILVLSVSCGESVECSAENHCLVDANGESSCEEGYQWVNPDAAADYRCEEMPHVDIPVLGNGAHSLDSVTLTVMSSASDNLNAPRDLEFHPTVLGSGDAEGVLGGGGGLKALLHLGLVNAHQIEGDTKLAAHNSDRSGENKINA